MGLQKPGTLTVCSYNVHGFIGMDGRRDIGRIAGLIEAIDPDILGLQEVDCRVVGQAFDQLEQSTGLRGVMAQTMCTARGGYGNALLSRRSLHAVRQLDLSWRRREPRVLLEARVRVGQTREVVCGVTHFGLQGRERAAQAARVAEQLEVDVPTILMGDLNEWRPMSRTLRPLASVLGPRPRVRSFPSSRPIFPLDVVWAHPASPLLSFEAYRSPLAAVASDHLPVVATLDVSRLLELDSLGSR